MNSKSTDSPGNTSCSWGCIQGPTRPLGGALLGSYWRGFHYCCFLDNFLCSSLSLSLWGTDVKTQNNNQKPNLTKEGSEKQKSDLMESRWGGETLPPTTSLFLTLWGGRSRALLWRRQDTYKSAASSSLGVMALIISGASVGKATEILGRITSEWVALLRVIHPLSHELFAFEMRRRIGGWRGWGGRGGWRTIPLPFSLPVNTHNGCISKPATPTAPS